MIDPNQIEQRSILQITQTIKPIQKVMIGHGLLMMFIALAMGLLLWVSLLGGFEIYPGYIINFNLPGTPEGWARAHRGIPMNSLMVIAFAFAIGGLGFSAKTENFLGKLFILTGWANTVFYVASNFSQNRGLSFGDNHFGVGDLYSWIALAPAYLFGVLSMGAILYVAVKCLVVSKSD
jgi:styrene-oxide isomerase